MQQDSYWWKMFLFETLRIASLSEKQKGKAAKARCIFK
jgi:hypothetical protein